MQKIPLELARSGMTLAQPVSRENGITIVGEGVELTDALIDRLQGMKISRVVVKGNPVQLEGGGASAFDQRLSRLDHLFRGYADDQWMRKVKAFLTNYFRLKAAAQAAAEAAEVEEEAVEPQDEQRSEKDAE
ncbi:hypothetical protein SAMN02745704_02549 [Paucidesulfovibrio gracilis DSM 16080]|uniref:Uncharacterized protein n=1 Tax=Paucidesulfovibrio gracilis DSM 16080 TaxID=1121449 RepID=A0A1T4XX11_9BACT|nr:hypothetical protein [Paucidesulfovibrio gracilis]SKA94112.1 hypothetical protein SAMN02745704_02549 [Paucidesulfovibrio gracilis DSM 16080]